MSTQTHDIVAARSRDRRWAFAVHSLRVCAIVALLLLIPSPAPTTVTSTDTIEPPPIDRIREWIPSAVAVDEVATNEGFWPVRDESDSVVALSARTLPAARQVVGYRGPTEALVLIDESQQIVAVELLQSFDTDEHVEAVEGSRDFFAQFVGWRWGDADRADEIDAVSSATLTSMALAEGVVVRMGGNLPSLLFPSDLTKAEVVERIPAIEFAEIRDEQLLATDSEGDSVGRVIRTGPLSDNVIGYQGPTELLLLIDADNVVVDIRIRSSFDNEPYVGYCKTEYGFWAIFKGMTLGELSELSLEEARVEGVSGATMTSMAIAETLVAASKEYQTQAAQANDESTVMQNRISNIRWTAADVSCVVLLIALALLRSLHWQKNPWVRRCWLVVVILVIGLWSGNLISMALLAGWGTAGIAWRLAPGLAALAGVTVLLPPLTKSNPYCNHLCPHGAVQQLIRPTTKSRRYRTLPKHIQKRLAYLPGTLLCLAYLLLLLRPDSDLSSWEPFHAYLFRIASPSAVLLAIATLLFSSFYPMGYCRMGCPTGRLIDYLRRSAGSDRLRMADGVVVGLLTLAVASKLFI